MLSHTRAFSQNADFELVGAVDPEQGLRDRFARKHNAAAHSSIDELLCHVQPEVFVVASPTGSHWVNVSQILKRCQPRAILCEKPLANDVATARAMVDACQNEQVSFYVNFMRRADPGIREVEARLRSNQIVMPFKAIVWYSKGLLHNGSHFVDLLSFWFGPISGVKAINPGRALSEYDAEPDVQVTFEQGSAILCAAREENYSHYTVEVVAANGRLRYEQGGAVCWQCAEPHPTLAGYRRLQPEAEVIGTDTNRYQHHVVEQLYLALSGGSHTLCTGDCALQNQVWLEHLITSSKKKNG